MKHLVKAFERLQGGLAGFGAEQIDAHLKLYAHYVDKLNEIEGRLARADRESADGTYAEYSELKRREAFAFNGAHLHELYFSNLAPAAVERPAPFVKAVAASFGSFDAYLADLVAAAKSTAGWVVTTRCELDGTLRNYALTEHHVGLPVLQRPILVLDCWEHAYMIEHGTRKADYLAAFVTLADWAEADRRLTAAAYAPGARGAAHGYAIDGV
jgi:Fe-Mn family superoxide dismutase